MELLDRSIYLSVYCLCSNCLSTCHLSLLPIYPSIFGCVCVCMYVCVHKFLFLWDGWTKAQLLSHVGIGWHPSLYLCIYLLSWYLFIHPFLYLCIYASMYLSMYHLFVHPCVYLLSFTFYLIGIFAHGDFWWIEGIKRNPWVLQMENFRGKKRLEHVPLWL